MLCKLCRKGFIGFLCKQSALCREFYQFVCIHKVIAQKLSRKYGIEIFASACKVVGSRLALFQFVFDYLKLLIIIYIKSKSYRSRHISVLYYLKHLFIRQIVIHMGFAKIKQVGDFVVLVKSLARCRHYNISSLAVSLNYLFNLHKLYCIRY